MVHSLGNDGESNKREASAECDDLLGSLEPISDEPKKAVNNSSEHNGRQNDSEH